MLTPEQSQEWINLAAWAARRRSQGKPESPLPFGVSTAVVDEITNYPDEWERDIKANVYAIEMDKIDEAQTAPQKALMFAAIEALDATPDEKTDLRFYGDWDLDSVTPENAPALAAETLAHLRAEVVEG